MVLENWLIHYSSIADSEINDHESNIMQLFQFLFLAQVCNVAHMVFQHLEDTYVDIIITNYRRLRGLIQTSTSSATPTVLPSSSKTSSWTTNRISPTSSHKKADEK